MAVAGSPPAPAADDGCALQRLLLRESQVRPLCIVLEDLHWIDSETQEFLDGLVESLPAARILLLVNYRPEYRHEWGSRTGYAQLRIDPADAGERAGTPPRPARSRRVPGPARAAARRADRGQSVLSRGERPDAGRERRARRGARCLSSRHARRDDPGPAHRAGCPRGPDRPAGPRGQALAAVRGGHRGERAGPICSRPSPRSRETTRCATAWPACGRPSSCTTSVCSPSPSTSSDTG